VEQVEGVLQHAWAPTAGREPRGRAATAARAVRFARGMALCGPRAQRAAGGRGSAPFSGSIMRAPPCSALLAHARAREPHTPLTGQASGTQSVWVRTACSREPRQQKQQRPAAAHRNGLPAPALASPVHTRARRRRAGADSAARRPRRRLLPRHSGSPAAGGAHSAACLGGQQSYDKTRRTRAPV